MNTNLAAVNVADIARRNHLRCSPAMRPATC